MKENCTNLRFACSLKSATLKLVSTADWTSNEALPVNLSVSNQAEGVNSVLELTTSLMPPTVLLNPVSSPGVEIFSGSALKLHCDPRLYF